MPKERKKIFDKRKTTYPDIFPIKKKVCRLCVKKIDEVDYKDTVLLKTFMAEMRGRILTRKTTGTCPKHQRKVAKAIKRARNAGILPFASHHGIE